MSYGRVLWWPFIMVGVAAGFVLLVAIWAVAFVCRLSTQRERQRLDRWWEHDPR